MAAGRGVSLRRTAIGTCDLFTSTAATGLSIDEKRDNIEIMLPDDLDLSGWEMRKALKLFRKSNPPLLEWLNSPIVYLEDEPTMGQFRALAAQVFNPKSCLYHF